MGILIKREVLMYEDVYDLEVESTHNFSVKGISVHNSSQKPNL